MQGCWWCWGDDKGFQKGGGGFIITHLQSRSAISCISIRLLLIGVLFRDSFRCGLFFPDPADKSPDKSALPYLNLYKEKHSFRNISTNGFDAPTITRANLNGNLYLFTSAFKVAKIHAILVCKIMSLKCCRKPSRPHNIIFGRYIFNATFDAKSECDAGSPNVKRYNDFCAEVVRFLYHLALYSISYDHWMSFTHYHCQFGQIPNTKGHPNFSSEQVIKNQA